MSAVKDYVASTTSGVATLNSLTGSVTIAGGTNIGVTSASGSITVTNQGVQTFNGLTGAVTGVTVGGANTFTALNTFNAGITTAFIYASTGSTFASTLVVNGGSTFSGIAAFSPGITTAFIYVSRGSTFASTLQVNGGATFAAAVNFAGGLTSSGSIQFRGTNTKSIRSTQASIVIEGVTSGSVSTWNSVVLPVDGSPLVLGSATENVNIQSNSLTPGAVPGLRIVTDDQIGGIYGTVIKPGAVASAERTQTLQDASGVIALTSQLMGAVNGSTAATNAVTSFNGLTGAVGGVTTSAANTFTALNTFNAGITTSFIYASTGSTFGARVDIAGILDVAGGVTFESTTDHAGVARFAAGITTSTLNITGLAQLNGNVEIGNHPGDLLTVSSGATFTGPTNYASAARFNAGLTASTLDVSGAARTTGDVTVGATLTVNGNFFVTGTVTTVNRTDLAIDDKIITLGRTLGSDALATDGGLSLSGTAARTWTWSNTRSAWESNQGVNVASTYGYAVNGTSVLTSSTLGSGVTTSSLQSLGTIGTGIWQSTAIGATYGGTGLTSYTIGDVIYASGTSSLAKLTTTTAGYLLSANGAGAAPEYKQLLVRDAAANSIATITSGSGTLTATIQNATSSAKGVASFDNTNFTVSTGAVTITGVDGGTY